MGLSQALNDDQCGKHSIHHGSTAVLEFDDILAGRARRPIEPQNQCLIEQLVRIRMPKLSDACRARRGQGAQNSFTSGMRVRPAHANDRHARQAGDPRQCVDGVRRLGRLR